MKPDPASNHSAIRAVTFDVGGTLIEPWPSVGQVYAEVAARFGVDHLEADWLTRRFGQAWKAQDNFDYSIAGWFAVVRETFGEHAVRLPEAFFPAVYARFAEAEAWRVYEDVLPALEPLAACGLKLGIISNWDNRLRPLLARLGLAGRFSSLVISCEVGATKPDPRLFRQAAWELGVQPEELLHVGDSERMDVRGAESAGATGRLILRGHPRKLAWQLESLLELEGCCD